MTVSMTDQEEIVLTAGKRGCKAVVRLERKHFTELDTSKVHQVSDGPYKGLLINKCSQGLENGEPAETRLEFMAYLINQEQKNQTFQDFWILKFWFRGKPDGITKKRTFTQYFQDLMDPSNFPKNYMGFMKKATVLLKNYILIRKVELEVEQICALSKHEPSHEIKSFVSLFTPDIYQYNFVPEISMSNKTFLTFMVKAKCDAHIALSANYGELHKKTIEIVIGAENNTRSMIKDGVEGSVRADALTASILSGTELRYFWISWADFKIEVGRGAKYGTGKFLEWNLPSNKRICITSLAVATDNTSHGQFEFAELLEVETDYSKDGKKSRVRKQLMWMAKKQMILRCLEDAYPNTMTVNDMLQQTAGRNIDPSSLVLMLKDLEKKHLIREVEVGRWMRVQNETRGGSGHELKLVRDIPQLTGREQPTIAIITSLYCEKLAVDAMIDDKTTFVKYKTEGESQVYTVGTIGRYKVVSTKLSKDVTSNNTARISAENTVTRLLGTFNKVEHVFVVGVSGGVPNFTDYYKHVRPGDVIVSMPTEQNTPMYIHCDKVYRNSSTMDVNKYNCITKSFHSHNKVLQNIVTSLKSIVKIDWRKPRPWDIYIEEGLETLASQETSFKRPALDRETFGYRKRDGTFVTLEHPKPPIWCQHDCKNESPNVRYGVIGSGKLVTRTYDLRSEFADIHNVKAFDLDSEAVMASLEGNRNDSFLVIRGVVDYADGSRKEWQPYAALAAAAYMKSIIMAL